jgi:hypothetical protein
MQVLIDFNQSTLDHVGPLGGDKGEKFLSELNEMQDLERDAGKESPDSVYSDQSDQLFRSNPTVYRSEATMV